MRNDQQLQEMKKTKVKTISQMVEDKITRTSKRIQRNVAKFKSMTIQDLEEVYIVDQSGINKLFEILTEIFFTEHQYYEVGSWLDHT